MSKRVSLNDKVKSTIGALTSTESDTDINVNKNINNDVNENVNNIIIIAKEKPSEDLKRQTYYLKTSTIKQIEKIAKKAKMGKSELVEKILSDTLANIVVKD